MIRIFPENLIKIKKHQIILSDFKYVNFTDISIPSFKFIKQKILNMILQFVKMKFHFEQK